MGEPSRSSEKKPFTNTRLNRSLPSASIGMTDGSGIVNSTVTLPALVETTRETPAKAGDANAAQSIDARRSLFICPSESRRHVTTTDRAI